MNGPPTREEIDAKLETARLSSETFFARMDARCTRMEAAFEARCQRIEADMAAKLAAIEAKLDAKLAAMQKAMLITAVTSTLTIILGVGAINATVFTGMLAAMDTGREAGAMMTRLEKRMLEQDARFNRAMLQQAEQFARMRAELDARLERERAERQPPPSRSP